MHFLPGYSPELNPVELLNGDLKRRKRIRPTRPNSPRRLARIFGDARTNLRP
jgi:transposase